MSALDFLSTDMQLRNEAAPYKPAKFGEVVESALYSFGQRTGFEITPVLQTAQDYTEREELLKQRFSQDEMNAMIGTDQQLKDEVLKADLANGAALAPNYLPEISAIKSKKLNEAILNGRQQDPVKWQGIKTNDELQEEKRNRARSATENYQEIASRATPTAAFTGSLIGGLGAAFTDPINIATLPFGATSGMGILKAMKVEALLNAGVEAAEVPLVASWQKELGYKYGVGEAALDVTTAGVGGAALTGIIRGARPALEIVGKAFDKSGKYIGSKSQPILQKMAASENLPSSIRDAATYMSRVAHIDENNPATTKLTPEGLETKTEAKDIAFNRQTLQDTQDAFKSYTQPIFRIDDETQKTLSEFFNRGKTVRSIAEIETLQTKKSNLEEQLRAFDENKNALFEKSLREQEFPVDVVAGYETRLKDYVTQRAIERENVEPGKSGKRLRLFDEETEKTSQELKDEIKALKHANEPEKIQAASSLVTKERQKLVNELKALNKDIQTKSIETSTDNIYNLERDQSSSLTNSFSRAETIANQEMENDLIFRPNDALQSMQRDIETMESLNIGEVSRADFERLLKERPDSEIETDSGRFSLQEIKEQIDADENILSAIKTCAIGGILK